MSDKQKLPIDQINQLSELLKHQDLTEIEVEYDDFRVKVRKEAAQILTQPGIATSTTVSAASSGDAASSSGAVQENFIEIKSPMVGTFYAAPSPDAEPFIKVGDRVKKGDPLCIVEAMKIMNELPSESEGEVVEICVNDGDAISFGQVIIKLK